MRKLATIQRIDNIQPIENADAIEVASILGWKVVVKKGEFNVGEVVVYCEIDSILPEKPEFEFLRNKNFRITTVRLRGQISQGICFPLTILPIETQWHVKELHKTSQVPFLNFIADSPIGMDVSEIIGVTKYEPPIPAELSGDVVGPIPTNLFPITDEDRIQILPDIIKEYSGKTFIATEKLDGSSCTIYVNKKHIGVCSRNWELVESETNSMWKFVNDKNLKEKLIKLNKNIALQGEIIGEGIQKNKYKLKGHTVKFFRAIDIDKHQFLSYDEMVELINVLELETVPILDWEYVLPLTVDEILKYAEGKSVLNKNTNREGVVFVRYDENQMGRISFKAISNKFLLKNNE